MPTFSYTKLGNFILDQLYGFTSANALKNSLRYVAEDVLGDPSANSDKVNAAGYTAASANASREATTRATGTTVGVGGVAKSAAVSATTTSGSYVDIGGTGLPVTITTSGRPVVVFLMANDATSAANIGVRWTGTPGDHALDGMFKLVRSGTDIAEYLLRFDSTSNGADAEFRAPPSSIFFIDTPVAGTYTYKIQWRYAGATASLATVIIGNCVLVAYEL